MGVVIDMMVSDKFVVKYKESIIKGINDFLASSKFYDYESYIKCKERTIKDVKQAALFAYKYMNKDVYKQFMDKALPFEPYFDGSNLEEKEALKTRISKLADAVRLRKANLIDILDNGITNLHQYLAMVRQLAYKYKSVPESAYLANSEYLRNVFEYDKENFGGTVSYDKEDEEKVEALLVSKNIKINAITKGAAFKYLKKQEKNQR